MKFIVNFIYGILLLWFSTSALSAQTAPIDSLENIYNTAVVDTIKLRAAIELAELYQRKNPDKAIEIGQQALLLSQQKGLYDFEIQAFKIIAISHYIKGEYQLGIDFFQYRKNAAVLKNDQNTIADSNNGLGVMLKALGKYEEAILVYNDNEELLKQLNDSAGLTKNYINKGNILMQQDNFSPALNNYYEALPLAEALNDKKNISALYNNIGLIHRKQENFSEALNFYRKSLTLANSTNDARGIYNAYSNIGTVYKQLANREPLMLDSSLMFAKQALNFAKKMEYSKGISISLGNLGDIYVAKYTSLKKNNNTREKQPENLLDSALYYYSQSKEIRVQINDKYGLAVIEISLGSYYETRKQYAQAVNHYQLAYNLANELAVQEVRKAAAFGLSQAYGFMGNYANAYRFLQESVQLKDSILAEESIQESTKKQMQYEFDKIQKQKEFEQLQKDLESQNRLKQQQLFTYVAIFGAIFMLGFLIFALRSRKKISNANKLLAEQKADIEGKNNELEQKNTELEVLSEELEKQRDIAIDRQKQITDSIRYAKRIQNAVLPASDEIKNYIADYFILFKPRDIVSGDYYWVRQIGNRSVIIAADCTGHGVPGAFMSMLGVTFLNQILVTEPEITASELLDNMKELIIRALHQTGKDNEAKDGMDMAVCMVDEDQMQFAGAYNSLYIIRDGASEIEEIKADKMPIGIHLRKNETFTNHYVDFKKGDQFYIFSDGYVDQFGGPQNRKFRSKQFKQLLLEIKDFEMAEQQEMLDMAYRNWQGHREQIDDVLVIGFKI